MKASLVLLVFVGIFAIVSAVGQFYVPKAYYVIDDDGHESVPVPLRRLRRAAGYMPPSNLPMPYPQPQPWGGNQIDQNAQINQPGANGWGIPGSGYGSARPRSFTLSSTNSEHDGVSISTRSKIDVGPDGEGFYDSITQISQ